MTSVVPDESSTSNEEETNRLRDAVKDTIKAIDRNYTRDKRKLLADQLHKARVLLSGYERMLADLGQKEPARAGSHPLDLGSLATPDEQQARTSPGAVPQPPEIKIPRPPEVFQFTPRPQPPAPPSSKVVSAPVDTRPVPRITNPPTGQEEKTAKPAPSSSSQPSPTTQVQTASISPQATTTSEASLLFKTEATSSSVQVDADDVKGFIGIIDDHNLDAVERSHPYLAAFKKHEIYGEGEGTDLTYLGSRLEHQTPLAVFSGTVGHDRQGKTHQIRKALLFQTLLKLHQKHKDEEAQRIPHEAVDAYQLGILSSRPNTKLLLESAGTQIERDRCRGIMIRDHNIQRSLLTMCRLQSQAIHEKKTVFPACS